MCLILKSNNENLGLIRVRLGFLINMSLDQTERLYLLSHNKQVYINSLNLSLANLNYFLNA